MKTTNHEIINITINLFRRFFLQKSIQGSLLHQGIHLNPPNSKSLQKLVVVVHMSVWVYPQW